MGLPGTTKVCFKTRIESTISVQQKQSLGERTQGAYMDPGRRKTTRGEKDRRRAGGGGELATEKGKCVK